MTSVAKPERANRKGGWSGGSSFPPEEPRPLFRPTEKQWSY